MPGKPANTTKLTAEQVAVVEANLGLVNWGTGYLARRWPGRRAGEDERRAAAGMALALAVRDHDKTRSRLATWFSHKLRGEVTEMVRPSVPVGYRNSQLRDVTPPATFTMHDVAGTGLDADAIDEGDAGRDPLDVLIEAEEREIAARRARDLIARAHLTAKEREALAAHIGLDGGPPETLAAIAARDGVTKQAIDSRCKEAMRKIRRLVEAEAEKAEA